MDTRRNGDTNVQQSEKQNVSWTQLYILRSIANGHESERSIQRTIRVTASTTRQQIQELRSTGFIEKAGLARGWRLTKAGVDTLSSFGWEPEISHRNNRSSTQKNETRITTTFGTAFKVAFGAMLGIFTGYVAVGAAASLIYWAGYNFIIKDYVPAQLLPYIPLDNPLIDFVLGLMTSAVLFAASRTRTNSSLSRG
jgi:hypothetical protein